MQLVCLSWVVQTQATGHFSLLRTTKCTFQCHPFYISTYDSKETFSALHFVNQKIFALNIDAKCLICLRGAASGHNQLIRIILVARNDDDDDNDDDMEEDDGGWTGLIWSSFWWPQIVTGSSQRVPSTFSLRFAPGRVPIRTLLELIRRR